MPLNFLDSHKFTSSRIDDDDEEDNKMNSRNIIMNIKIMKKEEEEKREDIHLVHFILTLGLFSIIPDLQPHASRTKRYLSKWTLSRRHISDY